MPTAEQRALLLLVALAVAGQGVRHLLTRPGEAPGQVQLLATFSPGSLLAQRDSAMRQARPLAPNEHIDVDRAGAPELARLPKVGPRLAKIILADREAQGPFGSLESLDRVAGVGPGLLKVLAPHVVFSAGGAAPANTQASSRTAPLNLNTATASELDALPGVGPSKAAAILRYRELHGPFNTVEDLRRVPGFGPVAVTRLGALLTAP
jgi:competence protein ComEA